MTERSLRHRFLRELLDAPELERYLGGRDLDLSVTDHIDAVRVRVRAGLDLLDRRVLATIVAAWRRQTRLALAYGIAAGIGVGAWLGLGGDQPVLCASISTLAAVAVIALVVAHVRIRLDMRALRDLRTSYRLSLDELDPVEELLSFARSTYGRVRTLAGERPPGEERS